MTSIACNSYPKYVNTEIFTIASELIPTETFAKLGKEVLSQLNISSFDAKNELS